MVRIIRSISKEMVNSCELKDFWLQKWANYVSRRSSNELLHNTFCKPMKMLGFSVSPMGGSRESAGQEVETNSADLGVRDLIKAQTALLLILIAFLTHFKGLPPSPPNP